VEGTPFGRYRLVELLGRGGMGEVWRAHDTATNRIVAIKLLPPHLAADDTFVRRFRREAEAAAQLNNPHIIPIHTYGEIDGRLYVDMRLVEGRDLQAVLAAGPLQPARAVSIIGQVANALHAAHKVGLVHRDVKPSNILIDDDDFAYLIDFGIARGAEETRMTGTGSVIGSWHYMSPERLRAGEVDARADIYALACVLYECLTGSPPYPGDNFEQQITAHLTAPPPRPSSTDPNVPAAFDSVIATGMAKDPDQRYATTVELARAAHDATAVPLSRPDQLTAAPIHGQDTQLAATKMAPSPPPPPEATPTPKRPMWRRPRVAVPALLAVVALIGGGVFAAVKVSQRHDNKPTASPAAAPPPNTGPFTGTYTANFGPETDMAGGNPGSTATETWGIRSACRPSGCVATASRRSGDTTLVSTLVFDDAGGGWLAVGAAPGTCKNGPGEGWQVFTLQPHPDSTLSGEYGSSNTSNCGVKRTVTFTRTGDVDVTSLPDPASLPPRVVSPAEALHGHYHGTTTYTNGGKPPDEDYAVRTDCLRTGDRCMSFFHTPNLLGEPMVFDGVKWIQDNEFDSPCSVGGTAHIKVTADYPLPQPRQDPITLLTGHGHIEGTGTKCTGGDFDEKYVRTGD
jgi:serine/threonine protein kinase